jgi:hypothetical protein
MTTNRGQTGSSKRLEKHTLRPSLEFEARSIGERDGELTCERQGRRGEPPVCRRLLLEWPDTRRARRAGARTLENARRLVKRASAARRPGTLELKTSGSDSERRRDTSTCVKVRNWPAVTDSGPPGVAGARKYRSSNRPERLSSRPLPPMLWLSARHSAKYAPRLRPTGPAEISSTRLGKPFTRSVECRHSRSTVFQTATGIVGERSSPSSR